jgi:hypothetical protein
MTSGPRHQITRPLAIACLAVAVAGCDLIPPPDAAPSQRPAPRIEAPRPEPSAQSRALAARFLQLQQNLLARGLLRTDGGGPDTPFGARELTENFVRVALYDEYVFEAGRLVARQTPAPLRRWDGPVRIGLEFGTSVSAAQRSRDRATVTTLAARLQRLTGRQVSLVDQGANYWVHVVSEDERADLVPQWVARFQGLSAADFQPAAQMDPSTLCLVMALSSNTDAAYGGALAVIRAELPDLLRTSCLHEEIVQGFGLANDHPRVRPSIFNDDEEFATLTTHDEMLLRILYDRRLQPGMLESQVRPILPAILAGLIAPES